jgi:hypothetical protein
MGNLILKLQGPASRSNRSADSSRGGARVNIHIVAHRQPRHFATPSRSRSPSPNRPLGARSCRARPAKQLHVPGPRPAHPPPLPQLHRSLGFLACRIHRRHPVARNGGSQPRCRYLAHNDADPIHSLRSTAAACNARRESAWRRRRRWCASIGRPSPWIPAQSGCENSAHSVGAPENQHSEAADSTHNLCAVASGQPNAQARRSPLAAGGDGFARSRRSQRFRFRYWRRRWFRPRHRTGTGQHQAALAAAS